MNHFAKRVISTVLVGILLMSTPMVSACHNTDENPVLTSAALGGRSSAYTSQAFVPNMSDYLVTLDTLSNTYQARTYYLDALDAIEPKATTKGEELVDLAMKYVGYRYVYGGRSPSRGFDCSGFVYYVYKQFGYTLTPGCKTQWNALSTRVSRSELQPGDIVFFSRNGKYSGIFHVGIYIGNGKIIHASTRRSGVKISDLSSSWYSSRYYGAKRVFN